MSDPWLTIIGIGEDGLEGLGAPARAALAGAEVVFGGPRHLALAGVGDRGRAWPVPFDPAPVLALSGRPVAVLASGDPFWHGAGGSLAARLSAGAWRAFPGPSTFSLAAARLGWRLEKVTCLGLHAAPFARARAALAPGGRMICLMRDATAVPEFAAWLTAQGFGPSRLWRMEALGGPREAVTETTAEALAGPPTAGIAPVAVAVECAASPGRPNPGLPCTPGLPDDLFDHDGQITKRPSRALTLAALAPRAGEMLWDIGTGSGSIAIEWLRAAPRSRAAGIEANPTRAARARANAQAFGLADRFTVAEARAPEGLEGLPRPDAVFIGGGATDALLARLWDILPAGTRLVANAVTLETEALVADWSGRAGGTLLRIELAEARPLGSRRGWQPARPLVQWSVTR
ncbi:precorrin-6y C5,15-methyltransferase (decarboxylating) subunit CbiE [Acidimangrovimonas sediminis]|uniref:precorrin-6y C5,15-methyltransferase (decarboxylating) subunit CbiE n=1 Tax=Acidimangrovimonas sediminis TaxID=2056283 RepID=UPI000C806F5C|nr:precorrin-6y C5,15-methyltransferase (decarboxylating) subunit CbiE [Acidimangrovimonas sediminis]